MDLSGRGSSRFPPLGKGRLGGVDDTMTKLFNQEGVKSIRQHLRHHMPKAELVLWAHLRGHQLAGYKFRRQYSVGPYVVDFYCPSVKLAIEVDGDSRFATGAVTADRKRQHYIAGKGIRFLRFTNQQVMRNLDSVLKIIESSLP